MTPIMSDAPGSCRRRGGYCSGHAAGGHPVFLERGDRGSADGDSDRLHCRVARFRDRVIDCIALPRGSISSDAHCDGGRVAGDGAGFGVCVRCYLAARIRRRAADDAGEETRFRDAAHGLVVWALGVAVAALLVGIAASYPLSAVSNAALGAASSNSQEAKDGLTSYFVDLLFRPARAPQGSQAAAAPAASSNPTADQTRAEATRLVDRGIAQGGLNDSDRAYLAQLVAQRTGMSPDEATRRVTDVENQARDTVKQAADKAAKAGAFLSFWTFMSLLFGGAAAVWAGKFGTAMRPGRRPYNHAERC